MPDDASTPPVPPPVPGLPAPLPAPPPVPAAVAPPPVPPPVPPSFVFGGRDAEAANGIRISRALVAHRRRADRAAATLGASALVIAAAALAVYVAWPQLHDVWQIARRQAAGVTQRPKPVVTTGSEPQEMPKPQPMPAPQPRATKAVEPAPNPRPDPPPEPEPKPKPELRLQPEPSPGLASMPVPAEPEPPAVDVEQVRALVDTAVRKAFDALRLQDFAAAKLELAAVEERALDDQQATDRLQRWQQLTVYAEGYPEHRDKALKNAIKGREFEVDGRRIGVAEGEQPGTFSIRDRGRNRPVTRDSMPPKLEHAIVAQWFAADGRPANYLFLGAAAIARREPDLGVARREWQAAADGGESQGSLLLGILDDPVFQPR